MLLSCRRICIIYGNIYSFRCGLDRLGTALCVQMWPSKSSPVHNVIPKILRAALSYTWLPKKLHWFLRMYIFLLMSPMHGGPWQAGNNVISIKKQVMLFHGNGYTCDLVYVPKASYLEKEKCLGNLLFQHSPVRGPAEQLAGPLSPLPISALQLMSSDPCVEQERPMQKEGSSSIRASKPC